jgi:hypothetical protein
MLPKLYSRYLVCIVFFSKKISKGHLGYRFSFPRHIFNLFSSIYYNNWPYFFSSLTLLVAPILLALQNHSTGSNALARQPRWKTFSTWKTLLRHFCWRDSIICHATGSDVTRLNLTKKNHNSSKRRRRRWFLYENYTFRWDL